MERAMGIEPTAQAWEAWVLPLYDARSGPKDNASGRPRQPWREEPLLPGDPVETGLRSPAKIQIPLALSIDHARQT